MYIFYFPIVMITILRKTESVGIVKLTVPEVVQIGSSGALLECHYSVGDAPVDALTVQWLFNRRDVIYQWSPGTRLNTHPRLEGKINSSLVANESYVPLHLVNLVPELSGEYTCVVNANGVEAQKTKPMLLFSPEEELELKIVQNSNGTDVKCYTRGVYPQPELTIELAGEMVPRQRQRAWREGALFAAESSAVLEPGAGPSPAALACRLLLAPAGYTAIRKANHATGGNYQSSGSSSTYFLVTMILLTTTTVMFAFK